MCESFTAVEASPSGLPLYPADVPLMLFHRPSSLTIPIQIIGEPVDGQTRPFALIQRQFDAVSEPLGEEALDINGATVWITNKPGGASEAVWNLPDGSQGYLRSRRLEPDQVRAILTGLTPRPADHPIPGFDFDATGVAGLQLVAEQLNIDVTIGSRAGSQCRVSDTGYVYRISAISGPPIYQFANIIDRPTPVDVGMINGTVIIISGRPDPTAPTSQDVVEADEDTWLRLLAQPVNKRATAPRTEPIGRGVHVAVELVPIDATGPPSSLTMRLTEQDGALVLEFDAANAAIADGAQYWRVEIDERLHSRATAQAGGVTRITVAEGQPTKEFAVNISTTDGDDFTIQTTGDITLQPRR